ncbi:MAG: arginine N-succinyltransferase [SAR324 cluster bacterium]|nr:arginine N-succinyltransferase [SAR324 cluster bacterium]
MMLIRPIRMDDLDQLEMLAEESGVGMTSLPANHHVLKEKICASLHGFSSNWQEPGDESYLFVLEDTSTERIVGTCGIIVAVGSGKPFYSYKISTMVHTSEALNIHKEFKALHLVNDYQGVSEICTLFLTPEYRKDGNGKLLSRCRFLFMAEFPQRFAKRVIAEMRGVQNSEGRSPFWRNLGRHFFDMDFSKADYLTATGNKQFISDLVPRYPIYVPLLPEEAQAVIGEVHEATKPALRMLEKEGFQFEGYVDIFDAGPTIQTYRDQITTVRESQHRVIGEILPFVRSEKYIISNVQAEFRVCLGNLLEQKDGTVSINTEAAGGLQVEVGDAVRFVPFQIKVQ